MNRSITAARHACINYPLTTSLNLLNPHFPNPTGGAPAPATAPSISGADLHNDRAAQVQAYSLSWQQQIGSRWFVSIVGAGDISRHIPGPPGGPNINLNQPGPVPGYDFNLLINTGNYSDAYFAPFQGYNTITYYTSYGKSSWNALELALRHPVGNNLYLTVAYTWSHNLTNMNALQDMRNLQLNYGDSTLNTPQVLTYSLIYSVPWMKRSSGWKHEVLAGWKVSDMTTIQTGGSLNLGLSTSHNGLATRPDQIAPVTSPHTMLEWFSGRSFAQPAPGFYGEVGVGTILSPGLGGVQYGRLQGFPSARTVHTTIPERVLQCLQSPQLRRAQHQFRRGEFRADHEYEEPADRGTGAEAAVLTVAAEKGLATDSHGCTRIKNEGLIRVHLCASVAEIGFFRILQVSASHL
jgi:hypothetical protein